MEPVQISSSSSPRRKHLKRAATFFTLIFIFFCVPFKRPLFQYIGNDISGKFLTSGTVPRNNVHRVEDLLRLVSDKVVSGEPSYKVGITPESLRLKAENSVRSVEPLRLFRGRPNEEISPSRTTIGRSPVQKMTGPAKREPFGGSPKQHQERNMRWQPTTGRRKLQEAHLQPPPKASVAICLTGQAREFELTGPSILTHLIAPFQDDAVVFVHTSLDANTYKLAYLASGDALLGGIRVVHPLPIPETEAAVAVLTSYGSRKGIQGLLQHFSHVEGCNDMIRQYEQLHEFRFQWVARGRLDQFWTGSPPPFSSLDPNSYYAPFGTNFGGVNDRFAVSNSSTFHLLGDWLDSIRELNNAGVRGMNTEGFLGNLIEVKGLPLKTLDALPMCVLTRHRYPDWVPVAKVGSSGSVNGVKCRPCSKPRLEGKVAQDFVATQSEKGSRFVRDPSQFDISICSGEGPWDENWEVAFDSSVQRSFAEMRSKLGQWSPARCMQAVGKLILAVSTWEGPSVMHICHTSLLSFGHVQGNAELAD